MPTITLDKKDLLKQIGKKLSDDKLKDRISMLGTDLEQVTKKDITVEVFPNRPDMLSSEGFARALASFIGSKKGLRNYKVNKANYKAKVDKKTSKVRPFAIAAIVKGIKFDNASIESLMQLQEKLHATHGRNRKKVSIGVYDLDTIKFPLTYTTKESSFRFTPLETNRELTLNQILNTHPKGRDYKHLLEEFKEYPIWIDAKGQVLSMPPIVNSEETKVNKKTKNVFIDVTGLDKRTVEQALNIVVTSLSDRGGKIYSIKVGNETYPNLKPSKIKLNLGYLNKVLGLNLKDKDVKSLLSRMGLEYKKPFVFVPAYRVDIISEIDLVEDIAIAYGYENFNPEIPNVATVGEEDSFEKFKDKMADILVGFGLLEANSYNLSSKKIQNKIMNTNVSLVELENALSSEYNVLRAWMIPSLLEVLSKNKHYELPQKIFEVGTVFTPKEVSRLGVVLSDSKVDYTVIRQLLDALLSSLGLSYKVDEVKHDSFIAGRVARISVKGKKVAYLGEIHPSVLSNFGLENPVVAFELNLSDLYNCL